MARAKVDFRGCARQKELQIVIYWIWSTSDVILIELLCSAFILKELLTETSQGKKLKTREMILAACVDFLKKGWTMGICLRVQQKNSWKTSNEEEEKFKGTAFN